MDMETVTVRNDDPRIARKFVTDVFPQRNADGTLTIGQKRIALDAENRYLGVIVDEAGSPENA